jgi:hypothetical protein
MIIRINENQEVIFTADGVAEIGETVDNATTFKVESKPEREAGKVLCFNPETLVFYHKDIQLADEYAVKERQAKLAERRAAEQKKAAALKWLTDNDWKVNKHTLGEWSDYDKRWIAYLSGREKARSDIDDAEYVLNRKYK